MAARDVDDEDEFSDASDGSDISDGYVSFSSDTSDDDIDINIDSQSSLGTFSSETSDPDEDDFWTDDLTDIDIPDFDETTGPNHDLDADTNILEYFFLMVPESFFDHIATETNRYAVQCGADGEWTATDSREIKAYFGLHILMVINQLPSVDQYWSQNKFIGKHWDQFCTSFFQ